MIDDGAVVEQGSHHALLGNNGIYARLVRRQLAKHRNVLDVDTLDELRTTNDTETDS